MRTFDNTLTARHIERHLSQGHGIPLGTLNTPKPAAQPLAAPSSPVQAHQRICRACPYTPSLKPLAGLGRRSEGFLDHLLRAARERGVRGAWAA